MWPEKMWTRFPYLMLQYETPKKGYKMSMVEKSCYNKRSIKKWTNNKTDRPRMT